MSEREDKEAQESVCVILARRDRRIHNEAIDEAARAVQKLFDDMQPHADPSATDCVDAILRLKEDKP